MTRRGVLVLAVTSVCAAVAAVRSRSVSARPSVLDEIGAVPKLCKQAHAATASMLQQDSLCESLCSGSSQTTYLSATGLSAEACEQCGATNVNIFQPGSVPTYYPGYYSYAGYYPASYNVPCVESSYDPWEWYDYFYKYDPALAPYYEPWAPPAEEVACEEPEKCAEDEPTAEEEEKDEDEPAEDEMFPKAEAPAIEREPEEQAAVYPWPRPHAQPAGTSTAGSFTMSGKKLPRE